MVGVSQCGGFVPVWEGVSLCDGVCPSVGECVPVWGGVPLWEGVWDVCVCVCMCVCVLATCAHGSGVNDRYIYIDFIYLRVSTLYCSQRFHFASYTLG